MPSLLSCLVSVASHFPQFRRCAIVNVEFSAAVAIDYPIFSIRADGFGTKRTERLNYHRKSCQLCLIG